VGVNLLPGNESAHAKDSELYLYLSVFGCEDDALVDQAGLVGW
jgi:hypothetical protein